MSVERDTWWERALCFGSDPAIFTPEPAKRTHRRHWDRARALCAECPVRKACLRDALQHPPTVLGREQGGGYAMFQGGHTPDELNQMQDRLQHGRLNSGTPA